jgi:hypothetical protein
MLPNFFPYQGLKPLLEMISKTRGLGPIDHTCDLKSFPGFGLNPLAIDVCLISIQIWIFELKLESHYFSSDWTLEQILSHSSENSHSPADPY